MTKRKVYILQGCSGSGKSTHAKSLNGLIVSADHYFEVNGAYEFDPSLLGAAHRACMRAYARALSHEFPTVIVDNTNTTEREIAPYYLLAESLGYEVEIHSIQADPIKAHARNRHGVPLEVVQKQADRIARYSARAVRRIPSK